MSVQEFSTLQKKNLKLQDKVYSQYNEYRNELDALKEENIRIQRALKNEKQKGQEIFNDFTKRISKMERQLDELNYTPPYAQNSPKNQNSGSFSRLQQLFAQLDEEGRRIDAETEKVFAFCREPPDFYKPISSPPPLPQQQQVSQPVFKFVPLSVNSYSGQNSGNSRQSPIPDLSTNDDNIFNSPSNSPREEVPQIQNMPRMNTKTSSILNTTTPESPFPLESPPQVVKQPLAKQQISAKQSNGQISQASGLPGSQIHDLDFDILDEEESDSDDDRVTVEPGAEIPSSSFEKLGVQKTATFSQSSDQKPQSETIPLGKSLADKQSIQTEPMNIKTKKQAAPSIKSVPPPKNIPVKEMAKSNAKVNDDDGWGSDDDSFNIDIEVPDDIMGNGNQDTW